MERIFSFVVPMPSHYGKNYSFKNPIQGTRFQELLWTGTISEVVSRTGYQSSLPFMEPTVSKEQEGGVRGR
jgi:hypothetical protein